MIVMLTRLLLLVLLMFCSMKELLNVIKKMIDKAVMDEEELKEEVATAGVPKKQNFDAPIEVRCDEKKVAATEAVLRKIAARIKGEALHYPALTDDKGKAMAMEEEETKNIPGERWQSSRKRDRYFQGIQVRLAYFQTHLPLIRDIEGVLSLLDIIMGQPVMI